MGARRYSPSTGRFLQYDVYYDALEDFGLAEDPINQNRYVLAGANPVNFVEIDGHAAGPLQMCAALQQPWVKKHERLAYKDFCARARASARDAPAGPWGLFKSCGRSALCTNVVSIGVGGVAASAGVACGPLAGVCAVGLAAVGRGVTAGLLTKHGGASSGDALKTGIFAGATGGAGRAVMNKFPKLDPVKQLKRAGQDLNRKRKGQSVTDVQRGETKMVRNKKGQWAGGVKPMKSVPLWARKPRG
jgi:RHS repeat-associated protein